MTETGRLGAFITKVKKGSLADVVGHLRAGANPNAELLYGCGALAKTNQFGLKSVLSFLEIFLQLFDYYDMAKGIFKWGSKSFEVDPPDFRLKISIVQMPCKVTP